MASDDEEVEESTRPKKSSWFDWTQAERGQNRGLEEEEASDLSAHLFNAYFLTHGDSRLRTTERERLLHRLERVRRKKRRKARKEGEKELGKGPDDGSRDGGQDEAEAGRSEAGDDERAIEAMLKPWLTKDGWTRWPLEADEVPGESEREFQKSEETFEASDLSSAERMVEVLIAQMERLSRLQRQASQKRRNDDEEHNSVNDRTALAEGEAQIQRSSGQYQPLADEDEINSLLKPTASHLTVQIDKILYGLDTTWNVPAFIKGRGKSGSSDGINLTALAHRMKALRPRDWRDVISVANLMGIDPTAVDRAAERCAKLFGAEVEMVTSVFGKENSRTRYTAHGKKRTASDEIQEDDELDDYGLHKDGYLEHLRPMSRMRLGFRKPKNQDDNASDNST